MKRLFWLCLLPLAAIAQLKDTAPRSMTVLAADPASCTEGQRYYNSASHRERLCTATNTWSDVTLVPLASGTSVTITLPNGFAKCTGTCTVTVPAPTAAGDQFCVWNGVGVSTAITLSAIPGVQYSQTDLSAYGTANTAATATAAAGNKICMVAPDTTHWDVLSSAGTWTMN